VAELSLICWKTQKTHLKWKRAAEQLTVPSDSERIQGFLVIKILKVKRREPD